MIGISQPSFVQAQPRVALIATLLLAVETGNWPLRAATSGTVVDPAEIHAGD
jgi:hypothetical protein